LVAAAKFLVAATKNLFVVPNFVAVTKPFFSVNQNIFFRKLTNIWDIFVMIHPFGKLKQRENEGIMIL